MVLRVRWQFTLYTHCNHIIAFMTLDFLSFVWSKCQPLTIEFLPITLTTKSVFGPPLQTIQRRSENGYFPIFFLTINFRFLKIFLFYVFQYFENKENFRFRTFTILKLRFLHFLDLLEILLTKIFRTF